MRSALKRLFDDPKVLLGAIALFVCLTVAADQGLKAWAMGLAFPIESRFVRFFPVGNRGVFGGYLADLDPWIVRIFFSVLFGFLVCGAVLVATILRHKRAPILKAGLVVYFSGVFGNVWDRMTTGKVVDYATIRVPGLSGMAFNFADGVVLGGAILIAVAIFREADALWYAKDQREGYWVEPRFQRAFASLLLILGFAQFAVIALYSFVFLKVYVAGAPAAAPLSPDRVVRDYLFGLCVLEGAALALTFAGSVLFSHRMVGPLIAFEQFVARRKRAGLSAPLPPFRVRRSDYFKDLLESIAERLENE